jgi:Domain of unknown function (DUF1844)
MSSGEKDSGDKPRGFAVTDRRTFTDSGESRVPDAAPGAAPAAPRAEAAPAPEGKSRGRLPPVDFPTFVLSLGSSALMHLGEAPHPGSGETATDLEMAKHTIDILSMLEQKTKGNLNASEAQLMENLLFDLRLRYVEAAKK